MLKAHCLTHHWFLKTQKTMTAKSKAIEDIKAELASSSRVFLAFRKELNPEIDNLVREYTAKQQSLNSKYHRHEK